MAAEQHVDRLHQQRNCFFFVFCFYLQVYTGQAKKEPYYNTSFTILHKKENKKEKRR